MRFSFSILLRSRALVRALLGNLCLRGLLKGPQVFPSAFTYYVLKPPPDWVLELHHLVDKPLPQILQSHALLLRIGPNRIVTHINLS